MPEPKSFLVTSANGDIADAVGRIIREEYPQVECHGADAVGQWPGKALFGEIHTLPRADNPSYGSALKALWMQLQKPLIIPVSEPEVAYLARHYGEFTNVSILLPNPELVNAFVDKLTTSRWLEQHAVPVAATWAAGDAPGQSVPLIIKPRHGRGSQDVQLIETADQLRQRQQHGDMEQFVAQEYLPNDDDEFTCALFRSQGQVRSLVMRRKLFCGFSYYIRVEKNLAIESMLEDLAEAGDLEGAINIQLRLQHGVPKIFEINPRFSSTVKMRHVLGFRDLVWAIEAYSGKQLSAACDILEGTEVFRMTREVIAIP